MKEERIIFMGTADFSEAVLKMLLDEKYNVVAVVSQPDRPVGRKKTCQPTLVKQLALAHNLPVIQKEYIKTDYQEILDYEPDLIISAAYGQIIPKAILDKPRLGCINVHASLLPEYRGGAPVHQAIIDGKKETGITIMYMATKMDAGDMIASRSLPILDTDTVGDLYAKLTTLGAELLKDTLPSFLNGEIQATPQDHKKVTFAPTITREMEHLSFQKDCHMVDCQVRGMNPWPVAYAVYEGSNIKIWKGQVTSKKGNSAPGTIELIDKTGIYITCGDGYLYCLEEIQVPGKKKMAVKDLLNGKHIFTKGGQFN